MLRIFFRLLQQTEWINKCIEILEMSLFYGKNLDYDIIFSEENIVLNDSFS